ncbi:MAG: Ig-like domain-containing protein [Bacteroidales bacterium]|nr:Ig-like domain-containing protein [Bacteroidales bacterium]
MKKGLLTSLGCFLFTLSFSQNNPPVAVDDTVEVISQVPFIIDVLANDYDPDGDGISIDHWTSPLFGVADTVNGKIRFKSKNFTEDTHFRYWIIDNGTPPMVSSSSAWVQIYVLPNPDVPVANPDTFELLELVPVQLDLLANDTDPNDYELEIYEVYSESHCDVTISEDSLSVTVIPRFTSYMEADFTYTARERNSAESYISNQTEVYIKILPNPDIPILVPDTAFTTGGISVSIPIMENDYDLQGDPFEILDYSQTTEGDVVQAGNNLVFTPDVSFKGTSVFQYRVYQTANPYIYSKHANVSVEVSKNPDCPVGVTDHAAGMAFSPITIDVLANDYDINGDPLEIWDIESEGTCNISGNQIIYTSDPLASAHDSLFYRVRQSNNSNYYSEWTPVYIDLSINPILPVAVKDNVSARSFFPVIISPLNNDIGNTADTLRIISVKHTLKGNAEIISDSLITYQAFTNVANTDSIEYIIQDRHNEDLRAKGKIYIHVTDHHYYDSLVVNNINAGVNADGMLFANIGQLPGEGLHGDFHPHFKYPAGEETNTIFNSLIWIGGLSDQDSLHFAGERYRQMGVDFQPGPVADLYDSIYAFKFWKLWKLNKTDIDYHRNNWWKEGYQPIEDISSWPGNGDVLSGQAAQLAPYFDFNLDGNYNPLVGDYPLIRGDATIFFMMNDDKIHTESKGGKLRVEIHGMVYGFDEPADSALYNTVFVHYDLINRSDEIYGETYIGIFTDFDIGYPWDDYVGSEVTRASYYGYNGTDFDYDITSYDNPNPGYGDFPPAQSVTVLAGPFMDADGTDNPSGGCDFSVNGLNFGNGFTDDERLGLTGFMPPPNLNGDPVIAPEQYNCLKSIFADNSKLQFGGTGHFPTAAGPECRFMFPGDSDPFNWGTYCVPPNPPYNQDGFYWTDSAEQNQPGDRRGTGAMGPFTFAPGQVQEIELAYCAANGWDGPVSSLVQLMKNIDSLRSRVNNGEIIVPNASLGVNEKKVPPGLLKVFPNPASTDITIQVPGIIPSGTEYIICNVLGDVAASGGTTSSQQFTVNISGLKPGFYLVRIKSNKGAFSSKFIKY